MARDTHHIVHNPNGGWDVKRGGGQRASAHSDTKSAAEKIGREISGNHALSNEERACLPILTGKQALCFMSLARCSMSV
jgi:hypothetical protein